MLGSVQGFVGAPDDAVGTVVWPGFGDTGT